MAILGKSVLLGIILRKKVSGVNTEGNETEETNVSRQIVSTEMNAVVTTHQTDVTRVDFAMEDILLNACSTELKASNILLRV